jgi:integral membrane sensor domain MASE1
MLILAGVAAGLYTGVSLLRSDFVFSKGWTVWWPVDGVVVAILLMNPRRDWKWIVSGLVLFELTFDLPRRTLGGALIGTFSGVVEVLIVSFALPAFDQLDVWVQKPRLVLRWAFFALILAPAATAFPAAFYFYKVMHQTLWIHVLYWMLGDSLGMALWMPLVLVLCSPRTYDLLRWKQLPETVGLFALIAGISVFTFSSGAHPLAFATLPVLLLIALRLGFSGAVLAVDLLAVIATAGTLHGYGPFSVVPVGAGGDRIVILQVFLLLAMLMSLPVAVMMLERKSFEARLQTALAEMERLATQDALTGLANRRHFDQALDAEWCRAIRQDQPISLLMIDVD